MLRLNILLPPLILSRNRGAQSFPTLWKIQPFFYLLVKQDNTGQPVFTVMNPTVEPDRPASQTLPDNQASSTGQASE
jgi:hypothetical protein